MGVYNAKANRKLTGGAGGAGTVATNSDASSAAAGIHGGIANSIANAAAAALGGGTATTNTNTASAVLGGGLATALGNSAAAALGATGSAAANGNTAAAALGGSAFGNTISNAFTAPGLSTSISSGNSLAFGLNALSNSGSNSAAAQNGGGLAAGGANAGAATLGLGLAGTATNSASATIGGNSFSSSSSSSIAQSLGVGSLNGQYLFAFPTVPVVVGYDAIVFRGCTDYKIPIIRRAKNIEFGPCQYSPVDCGYDPAFKLSQRFYEVNKYNRFDDGFAGYNDDGFEFFSVREKQGNRRGRQVYGYYYEGEYEAQHPSFNIQVENNRLWFQGHKDRAVEFEYKDGGINFGRYFEKKRDLGFYDNDRSVSDLFISSAKVNHRGENKGYEFHDKRGRRLASCFPRKW